MIALGMLGVALLVFAAIARVLIAHMREKKADDPYWVAIADQWEARLRDTKAALS